MANFLTFKPRNAALILLRLWLVASAFYYAEHLFSPNFYLGYDEGTLQKVLKYAACLGLSVCFCIAARAYGLLLFCALMLVVSGYLAIDRGGLEIATLSIMVAGTMMPFILVPKLWEKRLLLIGRTIVVSGAIVGVLSIVEVTVLTALFESAWASTGSIRSVSTLFNPNNLGLYVGVALVLLPFMRMRTLWTAICAALLIFALVASGSRTAWVSLMLILVYTLIVDANARSRLAGLLHRNLSQALLSGIALAGVYAVYQAFSSPPDIEVTSRGADLYTASIRWDNFVTFLGLIDVGLLFPDHLGERADYIQDNFYLVILNSFGVVGVLLLLVFLVTHFSPWRSRNPDLVPWKLVFAFYMVSGLSGSQLNSFPNNQLFFMSMGALWIYRPGFGLAHAVHSNAPIRST